MKITIKSLLIPDHKIIDIFNQGNNNSPDGLELSINSKKPILRGPDPSIVCAVFTGVGVIGGAFITGLLSVIKQSKCQNISITNKNGSKLEFPAELNENQLSQLIKILESLNDPIIELL